MADFRQIHTRIWKDEWFSELEPDAKLLFVYLFSNERASVCGMYELPLKFIVFESGIDKARVAQLLDDFEKAGKVYYRDGVVWVVNLRKYNDSGSPKVYGRIVKDIEGIPDGYVKRIYCKHHDIPYRYPIDTPSENSSDTDTDTDTETEKRQKGDGDNPPPPVPVDYQYPPEIVLYREVTNGLIPDYSNQQKIILKIQAIRTRLKNPPRDVLKSYLAEKYALWCSTTTRDGRPYSPTNPDWLDWCITDYKPPIPVELPKKKTRTLTGPNGEKIEVEE